MFKKLANVSRKYSRNQWTKSQEKHIFLTKIIHGPRQLLSERKRERERDFRIRLPGKYVPSRESQTQRTNHATHVHGEKLKMSPYRNGQVEFANVATDG